MKKRILALALAGTTAFSVFGAAMSASAADDWSTHVVRGNDAYTSYEAGKITVQKEDATEAKDGVYPAIIKNEYTRAYPYVETQFAKTLAERQADPKARTMALTTGTGNSLVGDKGLGYSPVTNATLYVGTDVVRLWNDATDTETAYKVSTTGTTYFVTNAPTKVAYYDTTSPTGFDTLVNTLTSTIESSTATDEKKADAQDRLDAINSYTASNNLKTAVDTYISNNWPYKEAYSSTKVNVDATYGYTATATGEVDASPLSRTGNEVESGNIYAYDYSSILVSPAGLAGAYAAANFKWNNTYDAYVSTKADALYTAVENLSLTVDNILDSADAVTGYTGGYSNNRTEVVAEFEDFLVEIGIADYAYNGDLVSSGITEAEFLSMYSYKYNGIDEYNFVGLVSDLYDTFYNTARYGYTVITDQKDNYTEKPSSELVYLMQQYDKYVDGSYVNGDEIDDSRWAELLISAIEAVDSGDFSTDAQYTAYKNKADALINNYRNATSSVRQSEATKALYTYAIGTFGRSSGTDKTELGAALGDLYFNVKNIPATYQEKVIYNDKNADQVTYAYTGYELALNDWYDKRVYSIKATYPVYPVADYTYNSWDSAYNYYGNEYEGINAGSVPDHVTAEYEWFANVYQLATAVSAKGNYQGIVDTVAAALTDAAADLEAYNTASGSKSLRLEEAVEKYDGKIDTDYTAKSYAAYEKSHAIAEIAEGNMQTSYAIEIAITAGESLTYQQNQVTITKGMVSDLTKKISETKKALDALRNDKDNYNAAQAIALQKAIDDAQAIVDTYNGTTTTKVNHVLAAGKGDKDSIVVSDVNNAITAMDDAINFKNVIQGWYFNGTDWQYGEGNSYLNDGWHKIDSVWYFFDADGTAKKSEWMQEDGKWYWFNSNCGAAIGWAKVDGQWYYFGGNNAMKTGWQKVDGNWYYLASSGRMITGWAQVDGKWYYMSKESNSLGQMLANTTTPDGYKVGADGAMLTK